MEISQQIFPCYRNDLQWSDIFMTNYFNHAIEYIEKNLNESINLKQCANFSFLSLRQLYREFYNKTGYPIHDYIRKRRINNACSDLKNTDKPITEIAISNGFDLISSFNKIFKRTVGFSPIEYRNKDMFFYFPPFSSDDIKDGVYQVVVEKAETEIGVCGTFFADNLNEIEQKAFNALKSIIATANKNEMKFKLYGKTSLYKNKDNIHGYNLFISTPDFDFWKQGMLYSGFTLIYEDVKESNYYLYITTKADNCIIQKNWDFIYNSWLPKSVFFCEKKICYEEYIFDKNLKHKKMRLSLPVSKKENHKIIVGYEPEFTFAVCAMSGENAEQKASTKIAEWVKDKQVRNITKLFITTLLNQTKITQSHTDLKPDVVYECGVGVSADTIVCDKNIYIRTIPSGLYAKLSDTSHGDADYFVNKIVNWLKNCKIYEQAGNAHIIYTISFCVTTMDVYLPINFVINGKVKV